MLINILKSLQELVQNCDSIVFHVSDKQVITTFFIPFNFGFIIVD